MKHDDFPVLGKSLAHAHALTRVFLGHIPPDHRGVDLICDVLPFGRQWYDTPDNAIGYAMHSSCSHDAVIRVYDSGGNVIETHEHKGDFIEP
jgi:hypothetical protein